MLRRLFRIVLASALLLQTACRPDHVPEQYLLFVDLTGSISTTQRGTWIETASQLLEQLRFGDSIAIFPITDHTLDAAPLYRDRVKGEGQSLEDLADARASLARVREEAADALRNALAAPGRSRSTDLFAVVDKVAQSWAAKTEPAPKVFIFSDFLESAARDVIDMETTRFPEDGLPSLVAGVLQRNNWESDLLQGAKISAVLNAVPSGERVPVNDRRVLHEFWKALFVSLGAELAQFDTYLKF
jgi:hypothetical protein